jgi:(p)ppGpp synthase/HD superfamily hydrolase
MMYSYKIEQAIRAAGILHTDQVRKGLAPYPYITHLVAVAFILCDYTNDESTIIAALLHDSLEDTDYTPEELETDFGPTVRDIVLGVTEAEHADAHSYSWVEKKERYLEALSRAPRESLLVAAADKIHNMRSFVEEYTGREHEYLRDFHEDPGTVKEEYQKIKLFLNENLQSPILQEFNHVHAEYMDFLTRVEAHTTTP